MQDTFNQNQPKTKVMYLITKGFWGGAQSYVYDLATNLDQKYYDITVLCGQGDELVNKLNKSSIRVIRLENLIRDISIFREIKSFIQLIKILNKESPDILHLNSSKAGFLGSIVGRIVGIPKIIFTVHGWSFNEDRSFLEKWLFKILHFLTIFMSHKTIVISKKTLNDIVNWPFVKTKTIVIYNGIKLYEVIEKQEAREYFEKNFGIKNDGIFIGTISELHSNKGIDIMLSVLKDLDPNLNFKYVVIGSGEKESVLKKLAIEYKLDNKVVWTGNIKEAKKYLRAFDIFTLTSRTEAMPYTILEAGLAGLPVLASKVGGIPEMIDNGENGILVLPKKNEILLGLTHLFNHRDKWQEMGEKFKEKVLKEFMFETMFAKTLEVYKIS